MLNIFKSINIFLLLLVVSFGLSCSKKGTIDPFNNSGMSIQQIEKSLLKSKNPNKKQEQTKDTDIGKQIPKLNKQIMVPPPPVIGGDTIMSVYLNTSNSITDALIDIGRAANVDVDIDPAISGSVVINATNRSFKEIIDRISAQANIRYSYKNKVLFFEPDRPFLKNYYVDYLSESGLWAEVQTSLENILAAESPKTTSVASPEETAGSTTDSSSQSFSVTANKNSGMFSIYANTRQHLAVEKYLADVNKQASAQVLIEAKVVTVNLTDTFKAGIDWNNIQPSSNANKITFNKTASYAENAGGLAFFGQKIGIFGNDINVAVNMLSTFGTTKAISSPRIHAMNNQKASLSFASKLIYFKIESQAGTAGTSTSSPTSPVTNATKQEEPEGVEITITPSINLKTQEVTMNISPKLTKKQGEVKDPTPVQSGGTPNFVPVMSTKEINTIAKIQSGNVLVIGGLMEDDDSASQTGIPFLSKIPILGWLFKSQSKDSTTKETVILIKATIINSGTQIGNVDRELQENFDNNRREFF